MVQRSERDWRLLADSQVQHRLFPIWATGLTLIGRYYPPLLYSPKPAVRILRAFVSDWRLLAWFQGQRHPHSRHIPFGKRYLCSDCRREIDAHWLSSKVGAASFHSSPLLRLIKRCVSLESQSEANAHWLTLKVRAAPSQSALTWLMLIVRYSLSSLFPQDFLN